MASHVAPPPAIAAPTTTVGSLGPDVYADDVTYTIRAAYFRSITVSPHDPEVAYAASYDGYVWKTVDGGRTWDESRLIVETRPFFGDAGERLYFGVHRSGGPGGTSPDLLARPRTGPQAAIISGAGSGGGGGAAANVNFGIGLPGGAPRLQLLVRKLGKPTAGVNIKQTLAVRGTRPTEVRVIVVHPKDPNLVFACSAFGLYRTTDGGSNWVRVYAGTKPGDRFAFHVAIDPRDPHRVVMGTNDGLWVSHNDGDSFAKSTAGGVGGGNIFWVYFNPYDPRYVFAATDSGLLRSADGGDNWDYIYFTTFPAARITLSVKIDPFDHKTGYISTFDGLFTTPDILHGGLESWTRLGGLMLTGMIIEKIEACPKHKGHLWAYTNMKVASVSSGGLTDAGGAFIVETMDGGTSWRVINSGNTNGSMQWFDTDPKDPDLLWIAWSRSLARLRRHTGAEPPLTRVVVPDDPPIGEVLLAAQMYSGTDPGRQLAYRRRSLLKALVPQLEVQFLHLRTSDFSLLADGLYPTLPYRRFEEKTPFQQNEFRAFLSWDLGGLVFNLDSTLFGRIDRLTYEVRNSTMFAVHRYYGELRRLRILMANAPPKELRIRLMYKLRMEELTSYVDFITGNYLTRWRQGDRPSGNDTKWWEPWTTKR